MSLIRLAITHFRNLSQAELAPHANGFNLIYGQNGSGKTSLLEAIYYLSLGRSFRSSQSDRIISNEASQFSLFAHYLDSNSQSVPIGIERNRDKSFKIRFQGNDLQSIAELTRLIPVRLINAQNYLLLDGGPVYRRKYLDWGLFYQRSDFLALWQKFERILKQRNAALKNKLPRKEVEIWTTELIEAAMLFDQARQAYVQELIPLLLDNITALLGTQLAIDITYQPGWNQEQTLAEVLAASYPKDAWLGYTQWGPHKADLKLYIQDVPAKDFLSRGQQKLFVCAMILTQGILLFNQVKQHPIFLVDDLPSELDNESLSKVMSLLGQQTTQVFLTAIDRQSFNECSLDLTQMFHVEHGRVQTVNCDR